MHDVIATTLLAMALIVFGLSFAAIRSRNRITRNWIKLDAAVIQATVQRRGIGAFFVVLYEYHSEDVFFEGQDSAWLTVPFFPGEQPEPQFTPGSVVTIYVNPDDHSESILFLRPSALVSLAGLTYAIICLFVGTIAFMI
jgi:hypothetical protein